VRLGWIALLFLYSGGRKPVMRADDILIIRPKKV